MLILRSIREAQQWCDDQRKAGKTIGFVPTMGYLHAGHTSLVDQAVRECDVVAASIYVNPTQFAVGEDLDRYPRDFENDCRLLTEHGCTMLFAPNSEEMYPDGFLSHVRVGIISAPFEGAFRPTFFEGVCLVVTKLLMAVKAHQMYLGQKDYQQTLVLRQLIRDLNIDVHVVVGPTIRESDGLAMSSRNVYMNPENRAKAAIIYTALSNVQRAISQHIRTKSTLDAILRRTLVEAPGPALHVDYASCVLAHNLQEKDEFQSRDLVVCLVAVRLGSTRLIDNVLIPIP